MMFGKLLKYDLRANLRTLLPLWLTTLGLSFVCTLLYGSRLAPQTALGRFLLLVLPAVALVLLMGAMFTVSVVYMVRGFSRGLLGQEGYLMFTLPVSTSSLIASKALSALIVEVLTVVASGLCVTVLVTMNATWAEMRGALEEMGRAMREVTDEYPNFLPTLCVAILSALLWTLSLNLHTYLACSVGQLAGKHRTALSIVAFCAISILLGKIVPWAIELFPHERHVVTDAVCGGCLWGFTLVPLLLSAVYFALTRWILARRLNLE